MLVRLGLIVGVMLVVLSARAPAGDAPPTATSAQKVQVQSRGRPLLDTDEKHTEARREALRAEIEQAVKQGDQAAAGRHWGELISSPDPPLQDCRQAIRHFEQRQDWPSLATAYQVTAKVLQAIIVAPPERFTRPVPPAPPESREGGPTVEVQIDLDGVWHKCKGPADGWFDWIRRNLLQPGLAPGKRP